MLTKSEIKYFMGDDASSEKKRLARIGQNYYEGRHEILNYRLFYYNADGELVEDTMRSNIRISHPFFTELVDQEVQFILSGKKGFVKADNPELQAQMDNYFNYNENFQSEFAETMTGCISKGFEYMYAYKNAEDKISFMCADSLGVVEVREKDTDDGCAYIIFYYTERIEKGRKEIRKVQVWDDKNTYYYIQDGRGRILEDKSEPINPKPHTLYRKGNKNQIYFENFGYIPFFRMDNNKKRISGVQIIKPIIDDYDLHSCSLSNNLVDFDTPLHVVKGFDGDDMDELIQNIKTKKVVGMEPDENAGIDIKTVDIPYQARQTKLELDEKNIYRFGMGLNTSGLKDTNATTNIAIKAAYSLLELKCTKFEIKLKQFMRKLIKVVIEEINEQNGTDYQQKDVYIEFEHEIMSNAQENAQIDLTIAQRAQVLVNTMISLSGELDDETIMQKICEALDIEYEEIKDKLPDKEEDPYGNNNVNKIQNELNNVTTTE